MILQTVSFKNNHILILPIFSKVKRMQKVQAES